MNWKRSYACGVVMAFGRASSPSAIVSDCVSVPVDARQLLHRSDLVFSGPLVESDPEQYTLTFRPDRVWKGEPSDRASVYVLGPPFVGAYRFRSGERYLVAARVLQKDEQRSNGIEDPAATVFGIDRPCGSTLPLSLQPALDKITRSRKPR